MERIIEIIQEMFVDGHIKRIGWKDIITKLEGKGIERNDIDDALNEAERRKIIEIVDGYCRWIDPEIRELEKTKTRKHFDILAEIFKNGKINFLPEEDVEAALRERGFDDEEIMKILGEADRDHVLEFYTDTFGPDDNLVAGCSWIPPEERQLEEEAEKRHRKWFEKWLEKKATQEEVWDE
ncbi:MAG: RecX family transcriptional regulator [Candidatus Brockarchaeota archaeon]|nr:RecX family transcriptional regulator [Candidatus Brockarchaeota archaeon]